MAHELYLDLRKHIDDRTLEFVACAVPPPSSPGRGFRTAHESVTWHLLRCLIPHKDHEEMKPEPCVRIQFHGLQYGWHQECLPLYPIAKQNICLIAGNK